MRPLPLLSAAAAVLFAASLCGQNLLRYRPPAGLALRERPAPSRAWTGAGPGRVLGNLPGPTRPFLGHPYGAVTINVGTGVVLSTDGVSGIDRTVYPRVGSASGVALPTLPLPAGVSRIYGMACDPVTNHLFVTDGTTIYEVDPMAGMAVLFAFPASPMNILAGLDYDPADPAHVYGVSTAGEIATYDRFAGVMVSVASPSYPWPGADAVGLALYKTAAPFRDFYVLYGNGQIIHFATGGVVHAGLPDQVGMAYLPTPVHLPSASTGGGGGVEVMTSSFVVDGNPAFGFEIHGLAATAIPLGWAIDVLPPRPAGPPVLASVPVLCSDVWVSGMLLPISVGATALPVPLPPGHVGWTLVAQPLILATTGCGLELPEALHCEITSG